MIALEFVAAIIIGYLLGAIPFGVFIARIFGKKDVREVGSGKTGMTNVLRAAGKKAAALSLVLDVAKGAAAVGIAALIFHTNTQVVGGVFHWNESAKVAAALAAIGGHSWSVFLKFKGGRGVATFFGGLAALYWPATVVGGIFVFGIGIRTKYMSMGSIIGAIAAFILLMSLNVLKVSVFNWINYPPFESVVFAMIGAIFIYVMHRDNIMRLYNGTERKIGEKNKPVKAEPSTAHNPK